MAISGDGVATGLRVKEVEGRVALGQHGGSGAGAGGERVEEPSHAERVRTLLAGPGAGTGMLSTWSRRHAGYPFGSLMPYALDEAGRPLLLISTMAMHTQNLKGDARTSLFVGQAGVGGDPLGAERATLVGQAGPVREEERPAVRELYLARHEGSRYWVDFSDFSFYRLEVVEVYYVGGFGVMGWVEAGEYAAAQPDPLAGAAAGILAHMNADHVEAMVTLARRHAGLEAAEATMTGVDRLGFVLRVKTADGVKGARINFTREVRSAAETRTVLVEMVRAGETPG